MRVVNLNRGQVLAERAREASGIRDRLKGLLGKDHLEDGEGLVLRPCSSIHSFFMRFRFDAAFFDRAGVVLHVVHAMKPWRISKFVPSARGVVELPAGVLSKTGTRVGDRLGFEVRPQSSFQYSSDQPTAW